MRKVIFAGVALALLYAAANGAIRLLNQPSDAAVWAGYALLVALVAAVTGLVSWLRRRL